MPVHAHPWGNILQQCISQRRVALMARRRADLWRAVGNRQRAREGEKGAEAKRKEEDNPQETRPARFVHNSSGQSGS
eukprot:15471697-Alexandrium_andersonii.AAC.1